MKAHKLLTVVLALTLVSVLAGCAPAATPTPVPPTPTAVPPTPIPPPKPITVAVWVTDAPAVQKAAEAYEKETGGKVTVEDLSVVYKDLLTYSFEGNEIYIIPPEAFPEAFVGKSFGQCAQMLYEHRDRTNPVILLGVRRQGRVIMNPRRGAGIVDDRECTIEADDALIAMAFSAPNLKASFGAS